MPKTADELRAIADPVERVHAAKAAMDASRAEMAAVIREAAVELHQRLGGYGAVGKALGVSRARAQQLVSPPPSKV